MLKCENCLYYTECGDEEICDEYMPSTPELEEEMLLEIEKMKRSEFFNEYYGYIQSFYFD